MKVGPSLRERFERHIARCPMSGCWLWVGGLTTHGYGRMKVPGPRRGAHRVSWEIHRGPIPAGMHVLHRCDIPACVNPGHLFLGTQADNMRDMYAKGRAGSPKNQPIPWLLGGPRARGERASKSKLTDYDVIAIRLDNRTCREIGRAFGINSGNVSRIKTGQIWTHIPFAKVIA